jgi:hypothetical protein
VRQRRSLFGRGGSNRIGSSRLYEFVQTLVGALANFANQGEGAEAVGLLKAVGAASHDEVLDGRKGNKIRHASS